MDSVSATRPYSRAVGGLFLGSPGLVSLYSMGGEHPISTVGTTAAELARLELEPGFDAALRGAYSGRHDVGDAVRWRLDPLSRGPSGRDDPAAAIASLRTRVYGRPDPHPDQPELPIAFRDANGFVVWMSESEARLLRLELELEEDSRALEDAIVAARLALAPAEKETSGEAMSEEAMSEEAMSEEAVSEEAVSEEGVSEEAAGMESVPPRFPRFQRLLRSHPLPVFAMAAVLISAISLPVIWSSIAPSLAPSAALLKIFNRPQGTLDIAPQIFSGGQEGYKQEVRDRTRFLGESYGIVVYGYRDTAGQVCMMTASAGDHGVAVCASLSHFAASGLTITGDNFRMVNPPIGVTKATHVLVRWGPEADLSIRFAG